MKQTIKILLVKLGIAPFAFFARTWLRKTGRFLLNVLYPQGALIKCHDVFVYVDYSNPTCQWYRAKNPFFQEEMNIWRKIFALRAPGIVLDVGAHFGAYTSFFAEYMADKSSSPLTTTRIISFEPDPRNLRCLRNTIKLNHIEGFVTVEAQALGNVDGEVPLIRNSKFDCATTWDVTNAAPRLERAPMSRLDTYFETCRLAYPLTHIKLDIDGFEPEFFAGANNTLLKYKPFVFFEFWPAGFAIRSIDPEIYLQHLMTFGGLFWHDYRYANLRPVSGRDVPEIVGKVGEQVTDMLIVPHEYIQRLTIDN